MISIWMPNSIEIVMKAETVQHVFHNILILPVLDLRHERYVPERTKQAASKQSKAGRIDFFLLIVSIVQSLGLSLAPKRAARASQGAQGGQIEAARASQGAQGRRQAAENPKQRRRNREGSQWHLVEKFRY